MAFSLSAFRAYGQRVDGPQRGRGFQFIELTIAADAADVDLDIGDDAGTFWGDVDAAELGVQAKAFIFDRIVPQIRALLSVESPQLIDRVKVASVSGAGEFSVAVDNSLPVIAVNAADGETAWTIIIKALLNDGIDPLNADFGTV